jgi:hypothetical protein
VLLFVNIYPLAAYTEELELNKKQPKPKAAKADAGVSKGVSDRWAVVWRGEIGEPGNCSYIHPTIPASILTYRLPLTAYILLLPPAMGTRRQRYLPYCVSCHRYQCIGRRTRIVQRAVPYQLLQLCM